MRCLHLSGASIPISLQTSVHAWVPQLAYLSIYSCLEEFLTHGTGRKPEPVIELSIASAPHIVHNLQDTSLHPTCTSYLL